MNGLAELLTDLGIVIVLALAIEHIVDFLVTPVYEKLCPEWKWSKVYWALLFSEIAAFGMGINCFSKFAPNDVGVAFTGALIAGGAAWFWGIIEDSGGVLYGSTTFVENWMNKS